MFANTGSYMCTFIGRVLWMRVRAQCELDTGKSPIYWRHAD